ncbi:Apoptosis regulator Bcl-2 [Acropora cervicornis]|uniref:Apoptosis regulator Bcl-2 n=1 Tax=Acropora cervicornis TaxID=6130 RepID=A0AAD9Q1F3_ACRCE|nr:Apoptosis regulator Bcl-2 [Acropora cervicornis]
MAPLEVCRTPNMSANRKTKNQEDRNARDLACDYIYYNKLGKEEFRMNTNVAATLRRIGREVEIRHQFILKNMCGKLDIRASSAHVTFRTVADEIFATGINWGRIVVLFCFAAEVAVFCGQQEIDVVENIVTWLSEYLSQRTLSEWIKKSGGWEAFSEQFKDVRDEREKFWWNSLLYTTLGLGTLAAVFYVKS